MSSNTETTTTASVQVSSGTRSKSSLQNNRTKEQSINLKCDVCNVQIPNSKALNDHYNGRKHQNRVSKAKKKSKQPNNTTEPNPESNVNSRPGESKQKQSSSSVEGEMNHSRKHSRKKNRENTRFFSNPYMLPNPHNNYTQHQGDVNWNWQQSHWQNPSWDYRNNSYYPHQQRGIGCDPRFSPQFDRNRSQRNWRQPYGDRSQNSECGVSNWYPDDKFERSENYPIEIGNSAGNQQLESKSDDCVPKTQVNNSPAPTSQNSEAKRVVSLKQNSPSQTSDETPDSEKQAEKRCILTENMTEKIAHWVNPCNPKDKAEVMRLVTEFSKSKKKENLLKLKMQTDSTSNESISDKTEEMQCHTSDATNNSPSSVGTPDPWSDSDVSRRKKRSKSETLQEAGSINPFVSSKSSGSGPPFNTSRKSKLPAEQPSKKVRRRSLCNSFEENRMSENAQVLNEVAAEKKRKEQSTGNSKNHKCSTAECIETCINEVIPNEVKTSNALTNTEVAKSVTPSPSLPCVETSIPSNPNIGVSNTVEGISQVPVKQEIMDSEASNMQLPPCVLEAFNFQGDHTTQIMNGLPNQSDRATLTPVESLINLFATGNIQVKKEFDDPLIDVIRTVDPEILNRVCEGQSQPTPSNVQSQPTAPDTPSSVLDTASESVKNSTCNTQQRIAGTELPSGTDDTPAVCDRLVRDADDEPNSLPFLKTPLKNILNEIQSICLLEDKVKENLQEAESKIQEYQALVDEWKTKKIKYHSEEETLRKQRNNLVQTMTDLVTQYKCEQGTNKQINSNSRSPVPNVDVNIPSTASQNKSSNFPTENPATSNGPLKKNEKPAVSSSKMPGRTKIQENEISILPPPVKTNNIPLIDLEDFDSPDNGPNIPENGLSSETDAMIDRLSKLKNIAAHSVTVNCVQFFEDYLYTCSNDFTARRFSVKNPSTIVTYQHPKRNVSHLCVEKVRGLTLVFTICVNSKIILSFKAEDGTVFRKFCLNSPVASICKSKGLIYGGLRSGSIIVCNWKDHKELVNISEPIRSIDSTYQGRLNILVTLSIHGNVSIRDADRNGLLIRYVKARQYLPLFMTVCSNCIYLSSAGILTVLDIESGTYISKYAFSAAYTSLAVYRDRIFTASFSGLVRCYSKDEEKAVKLYYGAGGTAITCIYVYHGWVFTGNKHGAVSVFKYDPNTVYPCKFGKCDFLFPRQEDLEFHVLLGKDHDLPAVGTACTWRKCPFIIPHNWDIEAIKSHVKSHLLYQHLSD